MNRRIAAIAFAMLASPVAAETITVCAKGCDYTSINAAIAAASDGDVIQLAAETYFEGEQVDTLGKAITLRGVLGKSGEPASVLDGAGAHRVLVCQSGETSDTAFERLVIQNGYGKPQEINGMQYRVGGGMYNENSSPSMTGCMFVGNSVDGDWPETAGGFGGGMCNYGFSSPNLTDCAFVGNSATQNGGGIWNVSGSSPILINCRFTDNSAESWGGGMSNNEGSSPSLTGCAFTNNWSRYGSGMYNYKSSSPTLIECAFTNNSSLWGGGMSNNKSSSPSLTNCSFTGNFADGYGGGVYNHDFSSPTLTDCTFAGNSGYDGGGMYNYSNCSPTLTSSVFAGNSARVYGGGMYNQYSCSPTMTGCVFTGNSSDIAGGGMINLNASSPILAKCTFAECCQVDPPRSFVDLGGNDYESWCDDCRENIDCRNNAVDAEDLGYFLTHWDTDDPQCDLDGDGMVRAADLGLLFVAWGPCN